MTPTKVFMVSTAGLCIGAAIYHLSLSLNDMRRGVYCGRSWIALGWAITSNVVLAIAKFVP